MNDGRGRAAPGVVAVERAGTPPSSLLSDDEDDEERTPPPPPPPSETPPPLLPSARSLRLRALTGAGLSVGTAAGGEGPSALLSKPSSSSRSAPGLLLPPLTLRTHRSLRLGLGLPQAERGRFGGVAALVGQPG